ncbi:Oxysterol-binding 2 [Wickerhamiella sorbophila]|uniref:Oxysterol-binding 2 n=1 Tax=Wickerhamiella sorbophila TaxID=45607 RepID=A0A2T0FH22_9ASCO|nr:Oxysterol-binding 2 [Wickerhamiella sorbophila]PRT54239.1 Oxysterol-binding 2 [Wickerhamiella sorbophila]
MDTDLDSSVVKLKLISALRESSVEKFNELADVYNLQKIPFLLGTSVESSSSIELVARILQLYREQNRDINETNESGSTTLHVAVSRGRNDVAELLLEQDDINDTIMNDAGQTPFDCVSSPQLTETLRQAQIRFIERNAIKVKALFDSQDLPRLEEVFANSRVQELLDINGINPDTGSTVLHDAARSNNLQLVKFILTHNGDPLTQDRDGKLPAQVTKNDKIKRLLNDAAKSQAILDQTSQSKGVNDHPYMEGYLKKWTNVTTGYRQRWFVLKDGRLSYYKKPEDSASSCRGSIEMKSARVKLDSSEKNRFEVKTGVAKYHLRANHAVETNRWVWALSNAIRFAKDHSTPLPAQSYMGHAKRNSIAASSINSNVQHHTVDSCAQSASSQSNQQCMNSSTASPGILINDLAANSCDDDDEDDDEDDIEIDEMTASPVGYDSIITQFKVLRDTFLSIKEGADQSNTKVIDAATFGMQAVDNLKGDTQLNHKFLNRLRRNLARSDNNQKIWARNLRDLQIEHEKVLEQLHVLKGDADESEDEFFDTIEGDDVVEERVSSSHAEPSVTEPAATAAGDGNADATVAKKTVEQQDETEEIADTLEQKQKAEVITTDNSYAGYENGIRTKLKIDNDNRPKISLWGILKNLIGKDMTRMTLPVTFNECISLIQRSAEDMEYVDLLDKAAATADPGLRMAYVAAFTVSSYSSTINRVAKPFNPLLGETYEYCRPDNHFRLVAEQVSHHPPIGALMAESPKWDFYGDSNVKSKFYGRSFDINPLGLWYINLRPDEGAGVKEELYSYRKVTSSVVGIMVGNPVVDNYGTLTLENHTSGYKCVLELKARGWRGGSAYKLEGTVQDNEGNDLYAIAGTWNDKIYAKKIGTKHKILLWQVHERPPAPFNLTPFAITLNAIDDNLKPWLPPTDTRLRPDQRCMEEGLYDEASDEKHRVEEKQRAARKQREADGVEWKPQWFEHVKHPVTEAMYYRPINDYWGNRKRQELADKGDIF